MIYFIHESKKLKELQDIFAKKTLTKISICFKKYENL